MPQLLVLVRHAESTNNDLYASTGQRLGRVPDPLLSPYGVAQVDLVAAALGDDPRLGAAALWSSPTARAVATAAGLVRAGVGAASWRGVELHPDLVEGGGIYERPGGGPERVPVAGRSLDELETVAGRDIELRWAHEHAAAWSGGFEHYDAIAARAARFVEQVRACGREQVVAVSHEWFAQHVIRAALGLPPGNDAAQRGWFSVPNASITEIVLEHGTAELTRLGDVHHLGHLVSRAPARMV